MRQLQGACPNGHEYTPDTIYTDPRGHRHCKTCASNRLAAHKAAKRRARQRADHVPPGPRGQYEPLLRGEPEWWDTRECKGVPVNTFYPPPGQRPHEALRICAHCQHTDECLEWAIADPTLWGKPGVNVIVAGRNSKQMWAELGRRRKQLTAPEA